MPKIQVEGRERPSKLAGPLPDREHDVVEHLLHQLRPPGQLEQIAEQAPVVEMVERLEGLAVLRGHLRSRASSYPDSGTTSWHSMSRKRRKRFNRRRAEPFPRLPGTHSRGFCRFLWRRDACMTVIPSSRAAAAAPLAAVPRSPRRGATVNVSVGGATSRSIRPWCTSSPATPSTWTNAGGYPQRPGGRQQLRQRRRVPPWTFSHTFSAAGTFGYHCAIHGLREPACSAP